MNAEAGGSGYAAVHSQRTLRRGPTRGCSGEYEHERMPAELVPPDLKRRIPGRGTGEIRLKENRRRGRLLDGVEIVRDPRTALLLASAAVR